MSPDQSFSHLPAPCIIDNGIVVNKQDMRILLSDLTRVHYQHIWEDQIKSQGEGCILEVFADPIRATMIANKTLYLNVQSFDYLELNTNSEGETYFNLVQENRQLRLTPLSHPLQEQATRTLNSAALEAMVTQVLSAKWDVQMDDDNPF